MVKLVMHLNERQAVIEYQNDFYLVSESKADSGVPLETLVFQCDENGRVKDVKGLKFLEEEWTAKGYTKVVTNQGVMYRIPKV